MILSVPLITERIDYWNVSSRCDCRNISSTSEMSIFSAPAERNVYSLSCALMFSSSSGAAYNQTTHAAPLELNCFLLLAFYKHAAPSGAILAYVELALLNG